MPVISALHATPKSPGERRQSQVIFTFAVSGPIFIVAVPFHFPTRQSMSLMGLGKGGAFEAACAAPDSKRSERDSVLIRFMFAISFQKERRNNPRNSVLRLPRLRF